MPAIPELEAALSERYLGGARSRGTRLAIGCEMAQCPFGQSEAPGARGPVQADQAPGDPSK
jgi:hypothetical protein